jgi:LmbE family N-acetylglucosaminyl deacetylase
MNILFLFAHLDDESFGPIGTIAKLAADHNVTVVSLCKGDRPGNEHVEVPRRDAFFNVCEMLGVDGIVCSSSDLHLEYYDAMRDAEDIVRRVNPDVIYTHSASDLHKDHRLVAEVALAISRPTPTSNISALYACEIVSATSWSFNQLGDTFTPNTYVDVTKFTDTKIEALRLYETELREYPDARSLSATMELALYRGKQAGVVYAEAFQQIFRLG